MAKNNEEVKVCSFCGQSISEDSDIKLIKAPKYTGLANDVYICSDCIKVCSSIIEEEEEEDENLEGIPDYKNLKPSQIKAKLDEYIIGQDYTKETLAAAVYNHYKMIKYRANKKNTVEVEKSNILMVGPTGSGKTYLVKTLAKFLDVPYAIGDASGFTAAGYVGADVESVLQKLIKNANGDIEKAQHGIVYIDEVDKLSRKGENPSITRDVSGEDVQQGILKMVEGAIVDVPVESGRRHPSGATIPLDTTNILFIIGGSFEGIEKIISKRLKDKTSSGIGFGGNVESKNNIEFNKYIKDIKVEDFKKFGIIPELLGRFPVICPLEELDTEALCNILTQPKNALIKQYQEMFKMDNVKLTFEPEAITEIAKVAMKRKTGARGLRGVMEDVLHSYMYTIPDNELIKELIITAKVITDNSEAIIKTTKPKSKSKKKAVKKDEQTEVTEG